MAKGRRTARFREWLPLDEALNTLAEEQVAALDVDWITAFQIARKAIMAQLGDGTVKAKPRVPTEFNWTVIAADGSKEDIPLATPGKTIPRDFWLDYLAAEARTKPRWLVTIPDDEQGPYALQHGSNFDFVEPDLSDNRSMRGSVKGVMLCTIGVAGFPQKRGARKGGGAYAAIDDEHIGKLQEYMASSGVTVLERAMDACQTDQLPGSDPRARIRPKYRARLRSLK